MAGQVSIPRCWWQLAGPSIPLTVHVAIGTDIVHMTPELDGAAMGQAALADFRSLCEVVARMAGGVWLNIGSAVVMPEVFLKAVSIARNLGHLARRHDDARTSTSIRNTGACSMCSSGRGPRASLLQVIMKS